MTHQNEELEVQTMEEAAVSEDRQAHDEALFTSLQEEKQAHTRKRNKKVIITVSVLMVLLIVGVVWLRGFVNRQMLSSGEEVLNAQATRGSISTTITGRGSLVGIDMEPMIFPGGVEIKEVLVKAGQSVKEGDVLATVNMSTVVTELARVQDELDKLDGKLGEAEGNKVSNAIKAGVTGRVKAVYGEKDEDISSVMVDHGALAVISLDGKMAMNVETDKLAVGDTVQVVRENGKELKGNVESVVGSTAVVLITDNGPKMDEEVTVNFGEETLGKATLYVHNPLSITGIAGTIASVNAKENAMVYSSTQLFKLKNTQYSANYDGLLREREALEETLMNLLSVYRGGAVLAPYDAMVSSVDFNSSEDESGNYFGYNSYNSYNAYNGYNSYNNGSSGSGDDDEEEKKDIQLVTLSPNKRMGALFTVKEMDIMTLEVGQSATIMVESIGMEYAGEVTEIIKKADTSTGVTRYSAQVEFDYADGMLAGMSANVTVNIQGVDDAVMVPTDAVHQTSEGAYVYTAYDENTHQYDGMVNVVTGISNNEFTEIVSGLEEGTTVYYTESWDYYYYDPFMETSAVYVG